MGAVERERDDFDALALALYHLPALGRDLQRLAGIEHAVRALAALSVVRRIGPARISDVAAELEVDLSVASRRIHVLQDKGFVDRVADPGDGRSSLIAISDAGTAKLHRAHQHIVDALAGALAEWEPDDVARLAEGLVRLRETLGSHEPPHVALDDAPAADATSTSVLHTNVRQEEASR